MRLVSSIMFHQSLLRSSMSGNVNEAVSDKLGYV